MEARPAKRRRTEHIELSVSAVEDQCQQRQPTRTSLPPHASSEELFFQKQSTEFTGVGIQNTGDFNVKGDVHIG
jgi:hypothetical protein